MLKQSAGQQISQITGQIAGQIAGITRSSIAIGLGMAGWIGGVAILPLSPLAPLVAPAQAATLSSWAFDPATHQLEIVVPQGTTPRFFLVAEPARIVLEIPNAEIGSVPMQQSYATGAVRQIRVSQFQPGVSRIVIEMSPAAVFAPGQAELTQISSDSSGDRWVLRPLLAEEAPIATAVPSAVPNPSAVPDTVLPNTVLPNTVLPNTVSMPSMEFPAATSLPSTDVAQEPHAPSLEPSSQPETSPPDAQRSESSPESSPDRTPDRTPTATPIPVPTPESPASESPAPESPAPTTPATVPPASTAAPVIEFGQPLPLPPK
jgi:hypothetical protein